MSWKGFAIENIGGFGQRAGWSYSGKADLGGLTPGKTLSGLELQSSDLPGVVVVQLSGATPIQAYVGDGPGQEIVNEVDKLDQQDFVPRFAAVPKIIVPDPYDGAAVLDVLRVHVNKDIVGFKLIEPILASQLDRSIQAAADAIRLNSLTVARDHLHEASMLVHKEQPDLDKEDDEQDDEDNGKFKAKVEFRSIDRLAARVIAFDLKYVEKRLKKD